MFVRLKTVRSGKKTYRYLHLVENRRDGQKVRQRLVASLGRLDRLQADGGLERLVRQLAVYCPGVNVSESAPDGLPTEE